MSVPSPRCRPVERVRDAARSILVVGQALALVVGYVLGTVPATTPRPLVLVCAGGAALLSSVFCDRLLSVVDPWR